MTECQHKWVHRAFLDAGGSGNIYYRISCKTCKIALHGLSIIRILEANAKLLKALESLISQFDTILKDFPRYKAWLIHMLGIEIHAARATTTEARGEEASDDYRT